MKLTTKLLLGATVVAGLSISAFAACATDVDFGGSKKITGLADGIATGEAVHYGQVLQSTRVDVVDTNSAGFTSLDQGSHRITVEKVGNIACLHGIYKNVSGANAVHPTVVGIIPEGYRPSKNTWYEKEFRGDKAGFIIESSTGNLKAEQLGGNVWRSNGILSVGGMCYPVGN